MFFNGGGTDVQVATQEPKSHIGFITYVVDDHVTFPFEVLIDGNSHIFDLVNRFKDMTMKVIPPMIYLGGKPSPTIVFIGLVYLGLFAGLGHRYLT